MVMFRAEGFMPDTDTDLFSIAEEVFGDFQLGLLGLNNNTNNKLFTHRIVPRMRKVILRIINSSKCLERLVDGQTLGPDDFVFASEYRKFAEQCPRRSKDVVEISARERHFLNELGWLFLVMDGLEDLKKEDLERAIHLLHFIR